MAYIQYKQDLSFTPKITGSTSAGVGTYTVQTGLYVLIGEMIFVSGVITWTAHTGTGNMLIDDLPFTVRNIANYDPEFGLRTDSIPWPAGSTMVFGEFETNTKTGEIFGIRSNGTVQLVQMNASGGVHFSGFYLKA